MIEKTNVSIRLMANPRRVATITPAQPVNLGGLIVKQPLPYGTLDQVDPFLLLHHAVFRLPGGSRPQEEGVPPHPHRGFEPVTFIYQGGVHHRDSMGNDSVVYAGGVQWMTAGRGVVHSERPPRELAEKGGVQEIIQLWINLPARYKMVEPRYQSLAAADTPTVTSPDGRVELRVATGTLDGVEGPLATYTSLLAVNATLAEGGRQYIPLPSGYNAFAYLLDGHLRVNDTDEVSGEHLVHFDPAGDGILLEALADTRVLLMAGAPLNEPVVASGPFVMNRSVDIYHAMQDYREGRMGTLHEQFG